MKVRELINKLKQEDPEAEVWMDNAWDACYGSDLTGMMGCGIHEVEDVRKIEEGIYLTGC